MLTPTIGSGSESINMNIAPALTKPLKYSPSEAPPAITIQGLTTERELKLITVTIPGPRMLLLPAFLPHFQLLL